MRAKELGHTIISSCEHGYQGRYIECYNLAKEYDLKFLFCAEAYWVKDRKEPDNTNCHIILAALNEAGRRDINRILSEANRTGFYFRPRVDIELLLSLNPKNVIVTTACLSFHKYEDSDKILLQLFEHFKSNFYLEVQNHDTDDYRVLNQKLKNIHYKYKIPLIFGCDSHYISKDSAQERMDFLKSKNPNRPYEDDCILDYPDGDTVYQRFVTQGVLSHDEIMEALNNTNVFLQVEEYNSPIFNKEVKLPSLYPDWTQEQKDEEYKRLIWNSWKDYKQEIPKESHELYEREIQREIDIVVECHMADYFILNYYIIKRGKELGGVITSTGRGSAVSFITNKLLGFTEVDRIAAQVEMYPERFMSATRILETGSLPDIDFNLGTIEPFAQAQKEIIGDIHAYPMIAYGTMQTSGAWKMYARAANVPFETANAVSGQIRKYEDTLKYADDDDARSNIHIEKYIEPKYLETYKKSEKYLSTIVSWSIAPSAYLLYEGNIEEEIGLIKIKDKLCCLMDGHWAEQNHFLKNDLLKVVVVNLISQTFDEVGIPRMSVNELLKACPSTDKVWDVYEKGCTIGINQVEQSGTSARVGKYRPKIIAELCAFVAAIRPGFKSMYKKFESREQFSYRIPSFDNLIQTEFMPSSFVLFQEQVMRTLNYAGFPMSDCYTAVKNIAKKRKEKVFALKNRFIEGFKNILIKNEHMSDTDAQMTSETLWKIVEDNSGYSFNASHAYCVALDSLYCAYLKAHYPLQFYGVYIRLATESGKKDKAAAAQAEAESYFRIKFPPYRFGQDNSQVSIDTDSNSISMSLNAIKGFNRNTANVLAECRVKHYKYLSDLLMELRTHSIKDTTTTMLRKIDYFQPFGNQREVQSIIDMVKFFDFGDLRSMRIAKFENSVFAPVIKKYSTNIGKNGNALKTHTFTDLPAIIHKCEELIFSYEMTDIDLKVRIQNQQDILGYISTQTNKPEDRRLLIVLDVRALLSKTDGSPWGYAIETQSIGSGKHGRMTIKATDYDKLPVHESDFIYAVNVYKNKKGYWYLNQYEKRG